MTNRKEPDFYKVWHGELNVEDANIGSTTIWTTTHTYMPAIGGELNFKYHLNLSAFWKYALNCEPQKLSLHEPICINKRWIIAMTINGDSKAFSQLRQDLTVPEVRVLCSAFLNPGTNVEIFLIPDCGKTLLELGFTSAPTKLSPSLFIVFVTDISPTQAINCITQMREKFLRNSSWKAASSERHNFIGNEDSHGDSLILSISGSNVACTPYNFCCKQNHVCDKRDVCFMNEIYNNNTVKHNSGCNSAVSIPLEQPEPGEFASSCLKSELIFGGSVPKNLCINIQKGLSNEFLNIEDKGTCANLERLELPDEQIAHYWCRCSSSAPTKRIKRVSRVGLLPTRNQARQKLTEPKKCTEFGYMATVPKSVPQKDEQKKCFGYIEKRKLDHKKKYYIVKKSNDLRKHRNAKRRKVPASDDLPVSANGVFSIISNNKTYVDTLVHNGGVKCSSSASIRGSSDAKQVITENAMNSDASFDLRAATYLEKIRDYKPLSALNIEHSVKDGFPAHNGLSLNLVKDTLRKNNPVKNVSHDPAVANYGKIYKQKGSRSIIKPKVILERLNLRYDHLKGTYIDGLAPCLESPVAKNKCHAVKSSIGNLAYSQTHTDKIAKVSLYNILDLPESKFHEIFKGIKISVQFLRLLKQHCKYFKSLRPKTITNEKIRKMPNNELIDNNHKKQVSMKNVPSLFPDCVAEGSNNSHCDSPAKESQSTAMKNNITTFHVGISSKPSQVDGITKNSKVKKFCDGELLVKQEYSRSLFQSDKSFKQAVFNADSVKRTDKSESQNKVISLSGHDEQTIMRKSSHKSKSLKGLEPKKLQTGRKGLALQVSVPCQSSSDNRELMKCGITVEELNERIISLYKTLKLQVNFIHCKPVPCLPKYILPNKTSLSQVIDENFTSDSSNIKLNTLYRINQNVFLKTKKTLEAAAKIAEKETKIFVLLSAPQMEKLVHEEGFKECFQSGAYRFGIFSPESAGCHRSRLVRVVLEKGCLLLLHHSVIMDKGLGNFMTALKEENVMRKTFYHVVFIPFLTLKMWLYMRPQAYSAEGKEAFGVFQTNLRILERLLIAKTLVFILPPKGEFSSLGPTADISFLQISLRYLHKICNYSHAQVALLLGIKLNNHVCSSDFYQVSTLKSYDWRSPNETAKV